MAARLACECKTPRNWAITYISKSPSDGEIIAIELRCAEHKVNWWWRIDNPPSLEDEKEPYGASKVD